MFYAHQHSFKFTVYSSCKFNKKIYLDFIVLIEPLLFFFSIRFSNNNQVYCFMCRFEISSTSPLYSPHYILIYITVVGELRCQARFFPQQVYKDLKKKSPDFGMCD